MTCPLCQCTTTDAIGKLAERESSRCRTCSLVFVHKEGHIDSDAELKRYLTHKNKRDDPRYVEFLTRLIEPLVSRIPQQSRILDFGSGPTPVLAELLRERGHSAKVYDLFFAQDRTVLNATYDAIACCETVEHFRNPATEWTVMTQCLRTGGWLGVMTLMYDDEKGIGEWWYAQDPTHICFYSIDTMNWIAVKYGLKLEIIGNRIALFQKNNGTHC